MAVTMGAKGQVVINKDIRDRLGIGPKWQAVQRLVGNHVEIFFIPPEHDESLKGALAEYSSVRLAAGEEMNKAREKAWETAAQEKFKTEGNTRELRRHQSGNSLSNQRRTLSGRAGGTGNRQR